MSSLAGFDLFKKLKGKERKRNTINARTPQSRNPKSVVVNIPEKKNSHHSNHSTAEWNPLFTVPASSLLFFGVIAFILSIYVMILAHGNWNWDDVQDARDMRYMNDILNLTAKDMSLMDKDLILQNNITSLFMRLDMEILARIAKDMILMSNISDINDRIDENRADRLAKDMILIVGCEARHSLHKIVLVSLGATTAATRHHWKDANFQSAITS